MKRISSAAFRIGIILGYLGLLAPGLAAAPKAQLWDRWLVSDPLSTRTLDHSGWERFLGTYLHSVDGITRVRYAQVSPADRASLESYLKGLQGVAVSGLSRQEQMAYWINLYNAATVKLILDHYPVPSITRINPGGGGLFNRGPWDAKLLRVEGEELSLNDIEHRILRPIWKDPRVHYVVNCASLSCPNLQDRAFTAGNLEAMLDQAARQYVGHPRAVRFDGGRLVLSSIYNWFQEDFGGSEDGVLKHLALYSDPQTASRLRAFEGSIRYEYDWGLNE